MSVEKDNQAGMWVGRRGQRSLLLALLFVSGFASLVYQVLWMRRLGLLFGSSALASAGTLSVFFGGLAIGGAIWSRRAPRLRRPLVEYGWVEIGVGLSGVLYFGLLPFYAALYAPLHGALGESEALLLAAKLLLAATVLLPPAILMGGTLPLMAQHTVRREESLGRVGTLLYATNTSGAAAGALAAGFWLPAQFGFRGTYLLAVFASLAIGGVAWRLGVRAGESPERSAGRMSATSEKRKQGGGAAPAVTLATPVLIAAATSSGALALALEVLWTRMFQQVLQNSVYTYSIILVTFLAALAVGALAARWLARSALDPWQALSYLALAAGAGALATPFLFDRVTDGMRYLGSGEQWTTYVASVFGTAAVVIFLPCVAVGTVFPFLLRVAERSGEPGEVMGRLSALNTAGSIGGSLVAGFVLLSAIGLWSSLQLVAVCYFVLAAAVLWMRSRRLLLLPIAGVALAVTLANPSALPGVRLDAESERLLGSWEGRDGYVAVIERRGSKRIKVNNYYALGSSAGAQHEQNQTLIPLMSHPAPEHLFYLGMGTGITAGAALRLPAREVTVAELVPEVVTAASEHFNEEALGLFTDPRATVLARDGRAELLGRTQAFDAILADLFLPWRAGVGNLYSRDHYAAARDRLRPGGVYVQWIPLYQVTSVEFWTIVRTFLDVFPEVRVWRGDFYVEQPILALVGSVDTEPLGLDAIVRNGRHLSGGANIDQNAFLAVTLPFYAGNLGESRGIVPEGSMHTDDRPIIEYQAPISHRNARAGKAEWMTGLGLVEFFEQLYEATPPDQDPYLSRLEPTVRQFVTAGLRYYKGAVLNDLGREEEAQRLLQQFLALLPVPVQFDSKGAASSVVEESS